MALVNYTGKNVLGVCMPQPSSEVVQAVSEIVRLLPGINEVDDAQLQVMKSHPLFQSRMASGLVHIMHETVGKDGKRSVEEMLSNIPKIFDVKLLKKIINTDGRDRVVSTARDQLDKIKNPAVAKQQESDEHFS